MINVSESILKACNSDSVTYVEYIIINGQKVIVKANLSDECYSDGHFIGTFIMKKLEFETENDIDYKKQEFVYYREINGESFKIGTFIVTDVNDSDTKGLVKVTAYDYTLKFANTYVTELDYASLKITMNDVIDEVCTKVGVERENQELANGDFIVDSNQFDTSAQYGNVVQAVAQMSGNFAKINENDKLEFIFKKAPQKTIQGSNIHIEDSTNENIPFKLKGNSKQEGTPTPETKVDIETVGNNGSVEIDVGNKNLFDKNNMNIIDGSFINSATRKIESNANRKCFYIKINANEHYTISREKIASNFIVGTTREIPVIGSDILDIDFNNNEITTILSSANAYYLVCYYKTKSTDVESDIVNNIQIEVGEQATEYVEHQSQTKILPIQEEMLEDDYISDVEYHTWKKHTITGNESWIKATNGIDKIYFYWSISDGAENQSKSILSNYFESLESLWTVEQINGIALSTSGKAINIMLENIIELEQFKIWLQEKYNSGNPVIVYYKLATPKSLPLTEEQKEIINGGIQLYEDVTNITTDNDLATLDITYSSSNVEVIEDYTELDDKRDTRPITIVSLGMTDIEGENVTLRWEEGIEQYGENYLIINDNPFAYTEEKRTQLIQAIFSKVKGFGYSSFETKYAFKPYLQCGDLVKLKNKEGQLIDSIILRISANHDDITLSAPSVIDSTVEYEQPLDAIDISKKTEYKVNKQEQTITQIVQKQDEFNNQLSEVNVSLEGISQKVENMADLTRDISGIKTITLENCVAGSLLELNILGNNTVFDYLYPADDLYPSDDLFPYGDSRIVVTNYPTGSEEGTITGIYELGITEVLRQNGDIVDEYILKEGKAQIIRRINKDGTIKTTEEIEELGQFAISLLEGTNEIEIKNYTANLSAKYAIKSDYTDIFATKVEMESSITQTAEEINLEVRKKVDENEVISSINQSAEQIQINANKISLKRKTN